MKNKIKITQLINHLELTAIISIITIIIYKKHEHKVKKI